MKILHVKSLRNIALAAGICVVGFLLAYLSGGMMIADKPETPPVSLPTVDLEVQNPEEAPAITEKNPEEETPAESPDDAPEEIPAEQPATSAANYYVRLNRGLSSSEEALVLVSPSQMKTSLEYRGKKNSKTLRDEAEIAAVLDLIAGAKRLSNDTQIISTSTSHDVTLTLPYSDGFGNLYIFEGYPDGAKKSVTLIQDNQNHLYQAKNNVANQIYDLLKPVESSLDAERINIYGGRNYEKGSLQAQVKQKADYDLMLKVLNSLEKRGSSLDKSSPDYLLTLLPSNSVQETDYCYLWLDEKNVYIAFADDSITVYEATDVTSSQMKKWIKEHKTK